MKTQLILLDTPIIVSDEEFTYHDMGTDYWNGKKIVRAGTGNCYVMGSKKIIAGHSNLPQIDFNGFEEKLGIVDVEKIFKDVYGYKQYKPYYDFGFKKAQQLNDKKFSLEDVKKAIDMAREEDGDSPNTMFYDYRESEIIQSLSQPKAIDIEVEKAHRTFWNRNTDRNIPTKADLDTVIIPQITNNKIKITKIL